MSRLLAYVAAVAALCAVLAGGWCVHLTGANKALGEAVQQAQDDLRVEKDLRAAERLVSARQATRLAALTTKQQETHARLQTALRASPTWSDERVPDTVAAALGLPDSATSGPAE